MPATMINELIRETIRRPRGKETKISAEVAKTLKSKKVGLFQNEANYTVLFPGFKPNREVNQRERYRADLIGFANDRFLLCEYKLYDQKRAHHGVWALMYNFTIDVEKLESAIKANTKKKAGYALFLIGLRNPACSPNKEQVRTMYDTWSDENFEDNTPKIRGKDYYSTLVAFKRYVRDSYNGWKLEERFKAGHVFLIGQKRL